MNTTAPQRPVNTWGFTLEQIYFPASIEDDLKQFRAKQDHTFVAQFMARKAAENLPEELLFLRVANGDYRPMGRVDQLPETVELFTMDATGEKPVFVAVPPTPAERWQRIAAKTAAAMLEALRRRKPLSVAPSTPAGEPRFKRIVSSRRTKHCKRYVELVPGEPCDGPVFRRVGSQRGTLYVAVA